MSQGPRHRSQLWPHNHGPVLPQAYEARLFWLANGSHPLVQHPIDRLWITFFERIAFSLHARTIRKPALWCKFAPLQQPADVGAFQHIQCNKGRFGRQQAGERLGLLAFAVFFAIKYYRDTLSSSSKAASSASLGTSVSEKCRIIVPSWNTKIC